MSASFMLPQFLKGAATHIGTRKGKVLVVVQLSGGNDGLNTVIPYGADEYYKLRPTLAYDKDDCIGLTDYMGLHPSLEGIADIWDDGNLAILNNVGYPNPNRSHFRSTDIWQTASDENQYLQTGWLGRVLDANCNNVNCHPYNAIEVDEALSLVLKGNKLKGTAFADPKRYADVGSHAYLKNIAQATQMPANDDEPVEYLQKTFIDAINSAQMVRDKMKGQFSMASYPQHELAKKLKIVADLVKADMPTTVYYVSISGFDTHAGQKFFHNNKMKEYAESMKAFATDLKEAGLFNDVLVMTFSEFGRRAKENGSKGTDHGTASNVFLMGGGLKKKGLLNGPPNLKDLDAEGDIKFNVDFRQVYSTILEGWLGAKPSLVMDKTFANLGFV